MASRPSWRWMAPAAEMAATAGGGWLLAAGLVHGMAPDGCETFIRAASSTPEGGTESVRSARDFTAATLARWGVGERSDDIVVVVSELLTNALRHAVPGTGGRWGRPPVRVGLLQPGPCVLCAVSDPSDDLPAPRDPSCCEESGRGLQVVASLSDEWGCTLPGPGGKVVWAVFATSGHSGAGM
jgi:histidine kinase-like protein